MNKIEAFPLSWPLGYKRTDNGVRKSSPFRQTPEKAQKYLNEELKKLGADNIIVSTNIPVRKDGYFYTDMALSKISDPGIAVYFRYKKSDVCMCADQYETVTDNIYAVGKSVNAIRNMERWGVSEFMERTFSGFKALPEKSSFNPWEILGIISTKNIELIKMQYKQKARILHPDFGGTNEKFHELQKAYEQAIAFANS